VPQPVLPPRNVNPVPWAELYTGSDGALWVFAQDGSAAVLGGASCTP
jgi:hypothetical protein